jgi:hypothetical protein
MLKIEKVSVISDEMRIVVETEWPEPASCPRAFSPNFGVRGLLAPPSDFLQLFFG